MGGDVVSLDCELSVVSCETMQDILAIVKEHLEEGWTFLQMAYSEKDKYVLVFMIESSEYV